MSAATAGGIGASPRASRTRRGASVTPSVQLSAIGRRAGSGTSPRQRTRHRAHRRENDCSPMNRHDASASTMTTHAGRRLDLVAVRATAPTAPRQSPCSTMSIATVAATGSWCGSCSAADRRAVGSGDASSVLPGSVAYSATGAVSTSAHRAPRQSPRNGGRSGPRPTARPRDALLTTSRYPAPTPRHRHRLCVHHGMLQVDVATAVQA